ncbi:Ankyrin repeat protein 2 [Giardia muris]|uniref:Ankyrin repeat protein 2 n=1 Tax=Giardia muris TaxID=5742 RepID=A0A4Z1TC51_GIAMU|nr:Ankyrin repeat protein 2 [Giardia muris]|eukprot:TNJ30051.1 Ankyrin repeat protein 2 [Giardia muris]
MPETALMWTAENGDLWGVWRHIGEAGIQDEDGDTALMKATNNGHAKCIPLLEREIGMQSNDGWTALMLAALNGRTTCARLLLPEAGKQTTKEYTITSDGVVVTFPPGTTALMMAACRNYPEVVRLLIPYEQGLINSSGYGAQWYATKSPWVGRFSQVCKLLEREDMHRLPPPHNPGEVPGLWDRVSELTAENEYLKKKLASLRNSNEEVENSISDPLTCIVCLRNPKDTLLQPCNHLCVCSTCAEQIMNQTCPLCRTPIESTVKVHL